MELIGIIILVFIVIALVIYNISIHKKVQTFNNISQKINSLNVLQDFMNAIGENNSVDEKLRSINDTLIEKFDIKYSTIVVFNGAEYVIKATNVDEKHWEALKNLHTQEIFRDSIATATTKYVTIEKESERLPYQQMEFARAKSAMFLPLYVDNVYIGYWIIESGQIHAYDHLDTTIIDVIKENIVSVLKTVIYQNTMENIVRKDQFTELYSAEYLYGIGKHSIDKYTTSTVCMFKITNLEEINENYSRKMGNNILIKVSNLIKRSISADYIFVRYMGPKFAIVFSGVEPEAVVEFLKDVKQSAEEISIVYENGKKIKNKQEISISPKINFVLSTYYKGTGMEGVTKKLEKYLDNANKQENKITYI
ncbi:MAG: diguanylate cyclase [Clostridia bacterium]|nr:diguanylate cyclase [Clostridia bacterium]